MWAPRQFGQARITIAVQQRFELPFVRMGVEGIQSPKPFQSAALPDFSRLSASLIGVGLRHRATLRAPSNGTSRRSSPSGRWPINARAIFLLFRLTSRAPMRSRARASMSSSIDEGIEKGCVMRGRSRIEIPDDLDEATKAAGAQWPQGSVLQIITQTVGCAPICLRFLRVVQPPRA
jgi:hypothetical protein